MTPTAKQTTTPPNDPTRTRQNESTRHLALLLSLYFAQGLPFGFQVTVLPAYLRTQGVSLTVIGFAGALSLPWMLKALWAPLVDRYGSRRIGHYRSWILPMQAGLIASALGAAFAPGDTALPLLLAMVFLMNLFAATQDIATDGLAVRILAARDLGRGNAIQVVGYKLGMLSGGGLLASASAWLGWHGLFLAMAGAMSMVFVATLAFDENALFAQSTTAHDAAGPRKSFAEITERLLAAAKMPGTPLLLLAIGSYKIGEYMISAMFKPFLTDHGFSLVQIGLWVGTYGMVGSLLGSALGGELARRWSFTGALAIASVLRIFPLLGQWWLTQIEPGETSVIAVTVAEHFAAGLITTAMFTFMMSRVDKRIGATHYTLLASIEVLGKSPGTWLSGVIADRFGYGDLFLAGVVVSVLFLGVVWALRRSEAAQAPSLVGG